MKNIRVMNRMPRVTDEEIRSFMNFDALLNKHKTELRKQRLVKRFIIGVVAISVGVISLLTFNITQQESATSSTNSSPATTKGVVPSIAKESVLDSTKQEKVQPSIQAETQQEKSKAVAKKSSTPTAKEAEEKQAPEDNNVEAVFVQAAPVSGYPALYEYFARELAYPPSRIKDSVNGVVSIAFTITKNGRPERIEIEQSLGAEFDAEAIRVISTMPDWSPATYNGKPRASRLSLPLTFQVKKIK